MKFSCVQVQPSAESMESNDLLFDLRSQHNILLNKMQHNQANLNTEMRDLDFSFCKKELIKLRSENERLELELENRENTLTEQLAQIQSLQLKQQVSKAENADFVKERDEQNLIKSREKEVKLDATFSELISRIEEKDNEISELSHQLYCKSKKLHQTELELKDKHKALQIQKKYTERSIAKCKQQNEDETGQLQKTISKMNKYINCLESELSEKKQELEDTNEHQESIKQSLKEKDEKISTLDMKIKSKSDEILELRYEQNKMLSDLRDTSHSLQEKLKSTETELEQKRSEIVMEKKQSNNVKEQMKEKIKEIEGLKRLLHETDTLSRSHQVQFHNAVKQREETEEMLDNISKNHNRKIKDMQEEINRKDSKINDISRKHKCKEEVLQELIQSQKIEATLRESINKLRNRNQENEKEISELEQQIKEISETLHQRENELKYATVSFQRKLENAEMEKEQIKLKNNHEKEQFNRREEKMKENTIEIEHLKLEVHRLNEFSAATLKREANLENINRSLKMQLKLMETELKHCELETSHKKELASSITEINRDNERLIIEGEKKEATLRDHYLNQDAVKHNEKTESRPNEVINKQSRQSQHLQERSNERDIKIKKDIAIVDTFNEQQNTSQEKEKQIDIFELQHQLNEIQRTFKKGDHELQNVSVSLQEKLEDAERDLEKSKHENEKLYREQEQMKGHIERLTLEVHKLNEISGATKKREAESENLNHALQMHLRNMETELKRHELEIPHIKELERLIAEMNQEIERLKLQVKKKETTIRDYCVKYENAVQKIEKSESELNETINKQCRQIQHPQEEVNKREHIKTVSALSETLKELQGMNQEKEKKMFQLENKSKKNQRMLIQRENEWQKANVSVQVNLQTSEREIETCKLETEQSYKAQEQLKEEIECLKLEVCRLNEISEATRKRESEFENLNHSLSMQLKIMEAELKQYKQDLSNKKEPVSSIAEMNRNIECLKLEVREKETTLQYYIAKHEDAVNQKENSESKLNEVINKQSRDIQYLQGEFHKRDIKISKDAAIIDEIVNELRNKNQEKENEIIELKHQLKKIQGTLNQREVEYQNVSVSLEGKLQNVERMAELSKHERIEENKQSYRSEKQMKDEIERLKIEVDRLNVILGAAKKKEAIFENNYRLLKDSENERELAVSKLNEIINKQNKEIQHLQEEIDKRNHKITTLEEVRLRCSHVEQALKKTKANKAELHETLKVLQNQNQEQEHRISQLTHQMNESLESFNQRESDLKEVEFSLQNKIQTLETDLEHHKEEITYEKQVSKSLQIKMTELSKNMESLMNEKEMREKENKDTNDYLSGIIDSQIEKIQHLENLVQQQDKKKMSKGEEEAIKEVKAMEKKMTDLKDQLKHTLGKLHVAETELNETKSRLSRVMGDRLTENNPNITDLSDRNRPTKIAEKCAELYDNQWTDAFDVLEKHFNTEEVVIEVLLHILQDIMSFCQTMAKRQLEVIKQEITFTRKQDGFEVPSDIQKLLKDLRKAMASAVVENLKKIYVSQLELSGDKILRAALDVDEYTSECIEICWFMVVQDPPVVFGPLPKEGSSFDTDFYKPYTKSGTHVEYSVWPSLLLHEGGPILAKGVAQGHGQRVKYV